MKYKVLSDQEILCPEKYMIKIRREREREKERISEEGGRSIKYLTQD